MPKWEYCVIDRTGGAVAPALLSLNPEGREQENTLALTVLEYIGTLGADGWELVGIETANNTYPLEDPIESQSPGVSGTYYWFKRPV